jgi:signal transduction histidine kinase
MMVRSLYTKLALALLLLFFLVGASFIVISIYSTEKYQQEVNQKLNSRLADLIVAEKIIMQDNRINRKALEEIFHMLMVINPRIEIYLLDVKGNILEFSAEPGRVKRSSIDLEPVKRWIKGDATLPLLGDDPRDAQGKKVFSAARIEPEGKLEGYLYVILGGETYDSISQKIQGSYILRLSIRVVIISLVLTLIAGLVIFAFLTRRLKRLSTVMEKYESGMTPEDLDIPAAGQDHAPDEIDSLVSTFRKMTDRINLQMDRLAKADVHRRELVANVSHDLRTPLATLRGYIETLLMKEETLNPEERRKYLKIAIDHCERLSDLITDLFELAKLEAPDPAVRCEPFSLSELVQDVVQKFELAAKEKNVNIITNVSRELPFTHADIALIERALENLLSNALRHTPEEGTISIVLAENNNGDITVQVSDTGAGIPEKDIPRIFDRFYQLDKSRKGKGGHSGLGLVITKRILELHNSSIQVMSALNSGTSFTFSLPMYRPEQNS